MKGKTLVGTVTNILCKRVSEEEAMKFALENYGVLATYIRGEYIDELKVKMPISKLKGYKGDKSKFFGTEEKLILKNR